MRRSEQLVDGGDAPSELVRLRLADEDRAGLACPPDRLGVARRDVRGVHRRAVCRAHALRVEQVLDPERDALERASAAFRPRRLGRDRLLASSLQAERRECAHQPIRRADAGGAGVEDLNRRQPPRRELPEEPLDGVMCVLVHRSVSRGAPRGGQHLTRAERFVHAARQRVERLQKLVELGYLEAVRVEEGPRPTTIYRPTEKGIEAVRAWTATPTAAPRIDSDLVLRIRALPYTPPEVALGSLRALRPHLTACWPCRRRGRRPGFHRPGRADTSGLVVGEKMGGGWVRVEGGQVATEG